ncbi:phenylalanine--tRNA ligase subunit alpha [Candidatus Williamhamiltonella defendens]|uniref:phenylalanine--tRNA ligase subunit alpha n=1 Tax=Candidatus Williamhamiltonella defendens TaxID=138072 RepID=UPI0015819081|nr:phenylalanine--tRNA ligase subunit alpha [Candidatus Hamiltonella defensa]
MTDLSDFVANAQKEIKNAQNTEALDLIRVSYFGKKGHFSLHMASLSQLSVEDRPTAGRVINQAKKQIQQWLDTRKKTLQSELLARRLSSEIIDVSLPGRRLQHGGLHPVTLTIQRIECFFKKWGFSVESGPEIEDIEHNFDALNIPSHHPARTEQDTFWFDSERLLRTQTSGVQIRTMKKKGPPLRVIAPGRVYRHDYDQTHTPMFHQMEGLILDSDISFANLKNTLQCFLQYFFQKDLPTRFRPSYFPFTEPSAEVDVMTQNGQWLEVLGCGMVHPNILTHLNIDPEHYSGFAFGMGIERLAMIAYGVTDLRAFFENDVRFLKQFK